MYRALGYPLLCPIISSQMPRICVSSPVRPVREDAERAREPRSLKELSWLVLAKRAYESIGISMGVPSLWREQQAHKLLSLLSSPRRLVDYWFSLTHSLILF